eukprot:8337374-Pyramimonas_sp.AAC.1
MHVGTPIPRFAAYLKFPTGSPWTGEQARFTARACAGHDAPRPLSDHTADQACLKIERALFNAMRN